MSLLLVLLVGAGRRWWALALLVVLMFVVYGAPRVQEQARGVGPALGPSWGRC